MLKIKYFPDKNISQLHFILRRTQCNAVKRNLIKRIVREQVKALDHSGKIVIGLYPPKILDSGEQIKKTVRRELKNWISKMGWGDS